MIRLWGSISVYPEGGSPAPSIIPTPLGVVGGYLAITRLSKAFFDMDLPLGSSEALLNLTGRRKALVAKTPETKPRRSESLALIRGSHWKGSVSICFR